MIISVNKISGEELLKIAGNSLNITCEQVGAMRVSEIVIVIRSLSASVVSQAAPKEKTGEKKMATKSKAKAKPKVETKAKPAAKSKTKKK